ncbi:hypothetical protein FRC01_014570, partial [Tulasnella sp. 417]
HHRMTTVTRLSPSTHPALPGTHKQLRRVGRMLDKTSSKSHRSLQTTSFGLYLSCGRPSQMRTSRSTSNGPRMLVPKEY